MGQLLLVGLRLWFTAKTAVIASTNLGTACATMTRFHQTESLLSPQAAFPDKLVPSATPRHPSAQQMWQMICFLTIDSEIW